MSEGHFSAFFIIAISVIFELTKLSVDKKSDYTLAAGYTSWLANLSNIQERTAGIARPAR